MTAPGKAAPRVLYAVPVRVAGFSVSERDDGGLLVNGSRSVELNDTALMVWGLCDGSRTTAGIVDLLAAAYPDAGDRARDGVVAAVTSLAEAGALSLGAADLKDPAVAAAIFGAEIVRYHAPTPEMVWHLEQIRQFVFGVVEPFRGGETLASEVDVGESGLEFAKNKDADTASSIGQSDVTPYQGLFESPSFRRCVDGVVDELRVAIPGLEGRLRTSGRAYYPSGGRMGWHSNRSAPCLRVYCSWTERERSNFFRYEDPRSGDLVTDWEPAGWTVKSFMIPPPPYRFWHCVGAESRRLSLGFRLEPPAPAQA